MQAGCLSFPACWAARDVPPPRRERKRGCQRTPPPHHTPPGPPRPPNPFDRGTSACPRRCPLPSHVQGKPRAGPAFPGPGSSPPLLPPPATHVEKTRRIWPTAAKRGAGAVALESARRGAPASSPPKGERDPPEPPRLAGSRTDAPGSPGRGGGFSDAARQGTRTNNPRVLKGAARWFYCTVKTSPRKLAVRLYTYLYTYIFYTCIQNVPSSLLKFWARCWTELPRCDGLMGDAVEVKNSIAATRYLAHASLSRSC